MKADPDPASYESHSMGLQGGSWSSLSLARQLGLNERDRIELNLLIASELAEGIFGKARMFQICTTHLTPRELRPNFPNPVRGGKDTRAE